VVVLGAFAALCGISCPPCEASGPEPGPGAVAGPVSISAPGVAFVEGSVFSHAANAQTKTGIKSRNPKRAVIIMKSWLPLESVAMGRIELRKVCSGRKLGEEPLWIAWAPCSFD